ncbi:hypothetical protein [Pedobacter aquatilis]|nr:hypothetical protein [Pedobacter aquatilis]
MENPKKDLSKNKSDNEKGLDDWNTRLDQNLEEERHNDVIADENAKEFSD